MARKQAVLDPDPVAVRVAVLNRVKSRRPPDQVRQYPSIDGGVPLISRTPSEGRLPAANLQEWADDREVGAFGGRVRLNPAEAAAHSILQAMRCGDPRVVREAVGRAGQGLDAHLRFLVSGVLQDWRAKAITPALDVTSAAMLEARRLGWDQRPRRARRGPEPVSQIPGRAA